MSNIDYNNNLYKQQQPMFRSTVNTYSPLTGNPMDGENVFKYNYDMNIMNNYLNKGLINEGNSSNNKKEIEQNVFPSKLIEPNKKINESDKNNNLYTLNNDNIKSENETKQQAYIQPALHKSKPNNELLDSKNEKLKKLINDDEFDI